MKFDYYFFEGFSKIIKSRFEKYENSRFITEDCIRYDFFNYFLKKNNFVSTDVILEYPLNLNINGPTDTKALDFVHEKTSFCAEFKLFKDPISRNTTLPVTENGAKVINDLYRLHNSSAFVNRFLILITSQKMITHLNKNQYNLKIGDNKSFDVIEIPAKNLEDKGKTFFKKSNFSYSKEELVDIKILPIFDENISHKLFMNKENYRCIVFKVISK